MFCGSLQLSTICLFLLDSPDRYVHKQNLVELKVHECELRPVICINILYWAKNFKFSDIFQG